MNAKQCECVRYIKKNINISDVNIKYVNILFYFSI
nr:MAG TPA: hypothetical protein [Caudoviricetes sp.]